MATEGSGECFHGDSLNCEGKLRNSVEPLSNNKTRNILRIRTDILNFEPELSLKLCQTKQNKYPAMYQHPLGCDYGCRQNGDRPYSGSRRVAFAPGEGFHVDGPSCEGELRNSVEPPLGE